MKMKRHKLCSNWQIVFIGDPDKQTLNTPQTSYPLWNNAYIPRVIDKSWLMQESPGLKPDWFGGIR